MTNICPNAGPLGSAITGYPEPPSGFYSDIHGLILPWWMVDILRGQGYYHFADRFLPIAD